MLKFCIKRLPLIIVLLSCEKPITDSSKKPSLSFTDVTENAGLGGFKHVSGSIGDKWFPESMGSGCGFIDYNSDGWIDILLVGGGDWQGKPSAPSPALFLYKNNKDGTLIYYGDLRVAGNRIRKTLGTNRKVAELKLKKLEYELTFQSLKEPERSKIQFHHSLIQFLKELESSGIKSEQIYVINRKVSNFTTYCNELNIKYIQDVTPIIAKQYIALRTKTRLYNKYKSDTDCYVPMILPRTINREIQMLTRFYKFCIEADWMDNNPFYNVKRIPLKQDRERFYFSEKRRTHSFQLQIGNLECKLNSCTNKPCNALARGKRTGCSLIAGNKGCRQVISTRSIRSAWLPHRTIWTARL